MTLSRITGSLSLTALLVFSSAAASHLPQESDQAETSAAQTRTDSSDLYQKVKEWRTAAMQHDPGKPDAAAVTIGNWPSYDLESVIRFVTKLPTQQSSSARRTLAKGPIRRALDLTDQEVKQADLSRILKKAALMHTDIALLELEKGDYQHKPEGIEGTGIFADGRMVFQPQNLHWQFARQIVELLSRNPLHDPVARQWYIATTAHMQSHRLLGYAGQNLKHALDRFPSDDRLLFYAGALHETWASPVNQNPILPPGAKVFYGSMESELKLARQYYQKAIDKNPGSAEARLRLGRVLGLMGNHRQALVELQNAAASIQDSQLSYYVSLYMGYEFRMLWRRSEAQEQYERAAELYPMAQSPLLSLSQLALDNDDVEGALHALQRIFALPRRDSWNDDPRWVYDVAHVRDAAALVEEMRKMFGEPSR